MTTETAREAVARAADDIVEHVKRSTENDNPYSLNDLRVLRLTAYQGSLVDACRKFLRGQAPHCHADVITVQAVEMARAMPKKRLAAAPKPAGE